MIQACFKVILLQRLALQTVLNVIVLYTCTHYKLNLRQFNFVKFSSYYVHTLFSVTSLMVAWQHQLFK